MIRNFVMSNHLFSHNFTLSHCQKPAKKFASSTLVLRSHLDGSKALRNCCECNDLLAKQNPKKSAQEASFGSFSAIFLYLFGGFVKESVGFRIRSKDTRRTCISQDLTARAVRTKRANLKLRMISGQGGCDSFI